ncbi:MAG: flagellin, partial [Pseudomonadota bacterium]|nr:flagellin [Pseudomonadota bacterium]
ATFAGGGSVADGDVIEFQAGGVTYTFEFIDDPSTTAPTDGDNIVVEYEAADSAGEVLAKLVTQMEDQGFSASYNSTGNLVVSNSSGLDVDVTSTTTGFVSGTAVGGDPSGALTTIETAINAVKSALAAFGTSANRLETQKEFISSLTDSLEGGVGQLVDADMAEESARLQALQTKQQLGIQALSIANQQPSAILSLFR